MEAFSHYWPFVRGIFPLRRTIHVDLWYFVRRVKLLNERSSCRWPETHYSRVTSQIFNWYVLKHEQRQSLEPCGKIIFVLIHPFNLLIKPTKDFKYSRNSKFYWWLQEEILLHMFICIQEDVNASSEHELWQLVSLSVAGRWYYQPGVGVTKPISPFRYFPYILPLSKHWLHFEYHVHIWQVSPQLSCGDTCQIWTWYF